MLSFECNQEAQENAINTKSWHWGRTNPSAATWPIPHQLNKKIEKIEENMKRKRIDIIFFFTFLRDHCFLYSISPSAFFVLHSSPTLFPISSFNLDETTTMSLNLWSPLKQHISCHHFHLTLTLFLHYPVLLHWFFHHPSTFPHSGDHPVLDISEKSNGSRTDCEWSHFP